MIRWRQHTHVFLGEVIDGDSKGTDPAMTYAYYHKVIKGKSPKNDSDLVFRKEETEKNRNSRQKGNMGMFGMWICL